MRTCEPSVEPLVHIRDAALPEDLFQRLLLGIQAVGRRANYGLSFWYLPHRHPPLCVTEQAIQALWPIDEPLAGAEWWLGRMHTTRVALDFHHDRDNALYARNGRIRHPVWSSVLYLNECHGGALAVTDQQLRHRADRYLLAPEQPQRMETVQPVPNRLARFSGRWLHGVLDARNQVPQGRLPGPAGPARLTLVFNGWRRRPMDLQRWSPAHYPELALPSLKRVRP